MRHIILDTETTGLNPATGDRIVEIGCVEMVNRRLTGRHLHYYVNPERDVPEGAVNVHGLTAQFLSDKPLFASIAEEIMAFVEDAEIVIHNAPFDLGFLDMEFKLLKKPLFSKQVLRVIDTLADARQMFPGKRNSLDALCERFDVRNDHRTFHGALLDAELLAEVYLAMTRGQNDLTIDIDHGQGKGTENALTQIPLPNDLVVLAATTEETELHEKTLEDIAKKAKKTPVWLNS
jgi:DNA polymerase-3 subunit epsilon